jgi:hypothetical protein
MTALMDRGCKEAMELSLDQRLTVAHRILEESDGFLSCEQAEQEWDGVICKRMARYDCGQAKSRSAADVFDALDKRLSE